MLRLRKVFRNMIKITVMKQTVYKDLMEEYENPILHACTLKVGDVFYTDGFTKPEGLCDSAWETIKPFASDLARGIDNFYDGWMKNKKSAMLSCNDGFRPVSFYIEFLK